MSNHRSRDRDTGAAELPDEGIRRQDRRSLASIPRVVVDHSFVNPQRGDRGDLIGIVVDRPCTVPRGTGEQGVVKSDGDRRRASLLEGRRGALGKLVGDRGTQVGIAAADQGQRRPVSDDLRRVAVPGIRAIQQRNRGHHLEVRSRSQESALPGLIEGFTSRSIPDVGTKHAWGRTGSFHTIGHACCQWLG